MKPRALLATITLGWMLAMAASADAAIFIGRITDRAAQPLPGAVVTVVDAATRATASAISDADGRYHLDAPDGTYDLRVELSGFRSAARPHLVAAGNPVTTDLALDLASFRDEVTVSSDSARPMLAEPEPNAPALVTRPVIDNAMLPNSRYDDVLTLMPGVLRAPDGDISIGGTRPEETALFVNGVNLTDPVDGRAAMTVPIESVDAIQVHSGGYPADLGPATGGVTSVQTRSGSDQFHGSFDSLFPRLLFSDEIHGVEYWEPNVGASGPLVKGRVFFEQGVGYRYDRNSFDTLAGPARNRVSALSTWTQVDAQVSRSEHLQASLAVDAQDTDHTGITAFFPVTTAPGLTRDGWNAAISDRIVTSAGTTLELHGALMRSTTSLAPEGSGAYTVGHDLTSGRYFEESLRRGSRLDVGAAYIWMPSAAHAVKAGVDAGRLWMREDSDSASVTLLRGDGSPSRIVNFGFPTAGTVANSDISAYVSDTWTARPWATVEAGMRVDGNSAAAGAVLSPRVAWTLGHADSRTSISGSAGLFADKLVLAALTFGSLPTRTTLLFPDTGAPSFSITQHPVIAALEQPRAVRWDIGLDRKMAREWIGHLRYQERRGEHELVIDPAGNDPLGALVLNSRGTSLARAFESTLAYRPASGGADIFVSYVRTLSRGNLNTLQSVNDVLREPFVQSDQQGPLATDVPHRVLVWGMVTIPAQLVVAPFLETRSGAPYSVIDDNWVYVGPRNSARLPWTTSLDLSVTRVVDLPGRLPRARIGLKLYRIVSVNSEREVQRDVQSPAFGMRYDPLPRDFSFVCTFLSGPPR